MYMGSDGECASLYICVQMNIYTMQSPTRWFIQVTKIKIDPMAATNIMVFTVSSKPPIINQRPDIAGEADASGKTW